MKRTEFEHAIRAAGSILGTNELTVIGSQAIHATISGEIPEAAQRSIEVDVVAFDDSDGRHRLRSPRSQPRRSLAR